MAFCHLNWRRWKKGGGGKCQARRVRLRRGPMYTFSSSPLLSMCCCNVVHTQKKLLRHSAATPPKPPFSTCLSIRLCPPFPLSPERECTQTTLCRPPAAEARRGEARPDPLEPLPRQSPNNRLPSQEKKKGLKRHDWRISLPLRGPLRVSLQASADTLSRHFIPPLSPFLPFLPRH